MPIGQPHHLMSDIPARCAPIEKSPEMVLGEPKPSDAVGSGISHATKQAPASFIRKPDALANNDRFTLPRPGAEATVVRAGPSSDAGEHGLRPSTSGPPIGRRCFP